MEGLWTIYWIIFAIGAIYTFFNSRDEGKENLWKFLFIMFFIGLLLCFFMRPGMGMKRNEMSIYGTSTGPMYG